MENMAERAAFLVRQRVSGFDVPDMPEFDSDESTDWFLGRLADAREYLEFGSGGSTFQAARLGVDFMTVDSDRHFLAAVEAKISAAGFARLRQVFRYIDIGRTGPWGRPVGRITPKRLERFRSYSEPPPQCRVDGRIPDLVLVDGRFRVACALKALQMLRGQTGWTVVVDDYLDRPDYSVLADYAEMELVGRMAVLTKAKPVSAYAVADAIRYWETVRD